MRLRDVDLLSKYSSFFHFVSVENMPAVLRSNVAFEFKLDFTKREKVKPQLDTN